MLVLGLSSDQKRLFLENLYMKRMIDWQVLSLTDESLGNFPDGKEVQLSDVMQYFTANEVEFTHVPGDNETLTHTYPVLDRYIAKKDGVITDLSTIYGFNNNSTDVSWILTFNAIRQGNGLYAVSYTVEEI